MPESRFERKLKAEADAHLDEHLQSEHFAPTRTTPQGTQADGVEHGHEERDIYLPAIIRWFAVLGITVGVVFTVMWGFMTVMTGRAGRNQVPAVFETRQTPPTPRLLPNPVDDPATPTKPIPMPPEIMAQIINEENHALQQIGLQDSATGLPHIPPDAAATVARQAAPLGSGAAAVDPAADTGVIQWMPSDASGGTRMENRLR